MRTRLFLTLFLLLVALLPPSFSFGPSPFSGDNSLLGAVREYKVEGDESLIEIARKFGLGYNEIVDANPALDPFVPGTGAAVTIPTSWVLPEVAMPDGIVVNLSELRLYYFYKHEGSDVAVTFPIGIGSEGKDTPTGRFRVIQKTVRPSWHVPESVRKEKPELPAVVPPGPDNPLGTHALRLSLGNILIHGTNRPWGVGRRVSHGCVRLYPEDIPALFRLVPNNTAVTIVRQPVKIGIKNGKVFIEVHKDAYLKKMNYSAEAVLLLARKNLLRNVSTEKLQRALKDKSGVPVEISEGIKTGAERLSM